MVRGTSRCAWLEEFLQGDDSDSDGEEEEEAPDEGDDNDFETPDDEEDKLDLGAIDPQVMRSLAPVLTSYKPPPQPPSGPPTPRIRLSDLSPEQMLSLRCFIRALDSNMSDKQYLHLIQEASVQKAKWFDICIKGHVAFVGPHADQEVCGTLHKRVDTNPETKKKKTITERCTKPRYKMIRTRRGNLQQRPRKQAVFLDPVPRIKAMYGCQQQAKMLRLLHEDMMRFISLCKARGNPHAGGYSDVLSGQALARAFEAGVFNDEQNGFFGLLTNGALVKENREGLFWIWTVTLYNVPIDFAFIILKRFKEAARGIWIFDSINHTWFLWRGYILFFLADLMGQAKQSGFAMSRGTFPCNNCKMPLATKPNSAGHYMVEDGQATYRGDRCMGRKKAAEKDTGKDDGGNNSDGDGDDHKRPQTRQKAVPPSIACKQVNAHRAIRGYYPYNGAPRPRPRTLMQYKAQISKAFNPTLSKRASKKVRTQFGISVIPLAAKSTLFDMPGSFPIDIAHLLGNNIPALLWKSPVCWRSVKDGTCILSTAVALLEGAQANMCYKIHEWLQFELNGSVAVLQDAGMPDKYVAHWADFVRLVLDRSPTSIEHIQTIDELADRFVQEQERLYVGFSGDQVEAMPLAICKLHHLGEWIKRVGNLSLVLQLQLECKLYGLQLASGVSPMYESAEIWNTSTHLASGVSPMGRELKKLGRVLTLFSPVKTQASEDWHRECKAWTKAFRDGKIRGLVGSIEDKVVYWDHYGRATLSNAKRNYLLTTRRKGEDDNNRRQASRFVTTSFDLTGAQTRKAMYTIGQAMAIVRVPPHVELKQLKLGRSRLAVVAKLYPPAQLLYKLMPFVHTEPTTPAMIPIEAVNKLVGAYYLTKDPRMYMFEDIFDNDGSTMNHYASGFWSLDHGGFGLIDLPWRLAIDHAKRVFHLRDPDGCFIRHLFDIRTRLQATNKRTPFTLPELGPNPHRRLWVWIWWAYFCHPPPQWERAMRKTKALLPPRWIRYFKAWDLSPNLERWATHVLYFPAGHGIQLSVNPTLFRGPNGEVMTPYLFVNASKRHQAFLCLPILPVGHQRVFCLPEQRWNAWWKALRKVRRVHSDAEDTAHLLSLGPLHPGSQLASPNSPFLHNRSTACVMCLSEAPETLAHLAVGCPFARRLWSALTPFPHPNFVQFGCPVVSRSERRLVELCLLFFHAIWKLSCHRRFSSDPLEPIAETAFEELRASIQESKGRVVSL
ncbi:BQ5605_C006g03750 [Microbotryum silenes-dioicae]|uniref:BQ5605_C006g03750 protein n=1 Tax=Microbotryum silenes-dioicae TaxID=796604 RepID=A0A2X0MZ90_9BASI|nr:BQ5605_C006g03750 [Microbotryum silenes-dioicae]